MKMNYSPQDKYKQFGVLALMENFKKAKMEEYGELIWYRENKCFPFKEESRIKL